MNRALVRSRHPWRHIAFTVVLALFFAQTILASDDGAPKSDNDAVVSDNGALPESLLTDYEELPESMFSDLPPAPSETWGKEPTRENFALTGSLRSIFGQYSNLPFTSDTLFLSDNRLRLEALKKFDSHLSLSLTGDLSLLGGSLVRTAIFSASTNVDDGNLWNLRSGYYKGSSLYFAHSLHRAYLTWETSGLRFDAGRKRVSWGVMQFWRPTDFFNPEQPLQIETGERAGTDCVHLSVPFSDRKSRIEYVYAPSHNDDNSWASQWAFTRGTYDFTVTAASLESVSNYGFSFDGYIGDGSFRGEFNLGTPESGNIRSWAIGGGYSFPNDVTLTAEFASNPDGTIIPARSRGLYGLQATWVATPLHTWSLFGGFDDEGNSLALMPRFTISTKQDDELSIGYIYTKGKTGTFYENAGDSAFIQFTRFF